jgi:hypothetical protein
MIRIDEIYDLILCPWIQKNRPGMSMYYLDPFGSTGIENICNRSAKHNHNYITFFDQEPIDLGRHAPTFDRIVALEHHCIGPEKPQILVSEKNSTNVNDVCDRYGWESRYYFFHGWAALDWYRGYYRTALLPAPEHRNPTHTFMSPNRIIGGERWHRVVMMYHLRQMGLMHNYISMPHWCPVEGTDIGSIAKRFKSIYPDIMEVFELSPCFPMYMPNETEQPMTSYHLDLWEVAADSMTYLVTETVADGERLHLTEKIFKPIALGLPFLLLSTTGSLEYLRSYGFRSFGEFWDESYDHEPNVFRRCEKIAAILHTLDRLSLSKKRQLWQSMLPTIEHNRQHFYGGGFESVLDQELNTMLCSL